MKGAVWEPRGRKQKRVQSGSRGGDNAGKLLGAEKKRHRAERDKGRAERRGSELDLEFQ